MIRHIVVAISLTVLAPAGSWAQSAVFVGGAATFPVGGFSFTSEGRFAGGKAGWQGTIGAQFTVGRSRLSLGPRAYYGSNEHEASGDKSNLLGATALLNYSFGDPLSVNPFLWGEIGVLSHAFKSDERPNAEVTSTAGTVAGGAGLGVPLGKTSGFIAVGYNSHLGGDFDTMYFGVYVGLSFTLGDE